MSSLRCLLALVALVVLSSFTQAQGPAGPGANPGQMQATTRPLPNAGLPPTMQPGVRPQAPGPRNPAQPDWIPLPPDHEAYLNKVLEFWEHRSSKIERFRCAFTRWDYDPAFSQRDLKTGELMPRIEATGEIMYAAPDKGLIRVDMLKDYQPAPRTVQGAPSEASGKFVARVDDKGKTLPGEHWVSDGKSIFEFLHDRKELHRIDLPANLQGQAITEGPLPFIFGAKADTLKQRYWFRVVTPASVKDQYWLEAWPKLQQDAANYLYVKIIIDQKEYLPLAVELNDQTRIGRRVYLFDKREVNWNEGLLKLFSADPFNPRTPGGYKLIVENVDPAPPTKPLDSGIDPQTARRFAPLQSPLPK